MAKTISEKTNKIVNVIISLGAAVVIIGAMAKIIHLSWADWALIVGLLTEAGIFIIYAFLPPPPVDHGGGSAGGKVDATELVHALNSVQKNHHYSFSCYFIVLRMELQRYCVWY